MYGQEIEIGDRVTYAPFTGNPRTIVITQASDDIKNGRAGFSGIDKEGEAWWGYNDQIIVVAKSKNLEG